jgi:LuxR family transcriptional regulator, maltose regulon positive regulatory protein
MYTHRYDAAGKLAKEALKSLPKTYNAWILMALWSQAETQKRTDHINKAIDTLYEAIRIGNSLEANIFQYAIVNSQAAALHFSGRRKEALAVCQKAISRSSDASDPRLGGLYAWLGRLHNEANQIDKAFANIQKGILLNEKSGVSLNLIFCRYYASQIYQAAGQKEKALEEIHYAQQLAGNASLSDENWLNAWEANLNLMQGNELQVEHWIRKEGPTLEQRPDYLNIESLIVHCRYLIHKGDLNHATKRLQTIEKYVRKRGYHRWLLTINLLQAIAWERKDKHQQALTFVKRALSIAAPEEYQRAFLDEDKLILKLVQELAVESPAFIMRLLRSASSQEKNNNKIPASILPDPLSEREIQVLELLTDGKKGPQIAKELFISYSTVRTHLKSIHRKLDVHSRQELLEKVRLLELI